MAPGRVQHEAWLTYAPVAPFGVKAFSIFADPREQALIYVLTVCEIKPFIAFGTLHLSIGNHCICWFGWTLLALVETPGGSHASTAIILFCKAWQGLATLSIHCFLEAPANPATIGTWVCPVGGVVMAVMVSVCVLIGGFVTVAWLRALLY